MMVKKFIAAFLIFVGLILLLCAVGGYENDMFDTFGFLLRAMASFWVIVIGGYILGR